MLLFSKATSFPLKKPSKTIQSRVAISSGQAGTTSQLIKSLHSKSHRTGRVLIRHAQVTIRMISLTGFSISARSQDFFGRLYTTASLYAGGQLPAASLRQRYTLRYQFQNYFLEVTKDLSPLHRLYNK